MSWDAGGGDYSWDDGSKHKEIIGTPGNASSLDDGGAAQAPSSDGRNASGFHDAEATHHDGYGNSGDRVVGGSHGDGCFNCGREGHMKSECPELPKQRSGGCFNCGEEGHNKADCPNPAAPREFTGTCRHCNQEGHRAAECPDAPVKLCKNCGEEGHAIMQCENPRKINRDHIEASLPEAAWKDLEDASTRKDLDDIKEAIDKYIKGNPGITYVELETAFRAQELNVYIIATEREMAVTYTNMDLQGNLDKKYTISYRTSDKPKRPKEAEGWPESPEENTERLKDAGEPVDRGVPKCGNCNELGHTSKFCPQEKQEITDRAVVKCYNCDEVGHRVRDCPIPRKDKFACRNCGQSGHGSKECPEPRSAEGVECRKCGETGHFSKECPNNPQGGSGCRNCGQDGHMAKEYTEPRNPLTMKCRNCDEMGHASKECPKPRDYSRVQCQNCKQMGHTKVRCTEPHIEKDDASGYVGGEDFSGNAAGENFDSTPDAGGESWASTVPAATADGNNWGSAPVSAW